MDISPVQVFRGRLPGDTDGVAEAADARSRVYGLDVPDAGGRKGRALDPPDRPRIARVWAAAVGELH